MINFRISTLTVLLCATAVMGNQDISYGLRFPTFGNNGATGVAGTGGGYSSGSSNTNSGMTARGRVVGNSILDLEDASDLELESDQSNVDLNFGQEPTNFPALSKPLMTGPSVSSGQMLETRNGVSATPRSQISSQVRPTMPSGSSHSNVITDRTVHRYVSVHVPPPEPLVTSRLRSMPTPKPETHYQIMFIKAPSVSPQELQEIQLPPPPRMKTMVYVLMRKPEMTDFIKLSQPPKVMPPSKPEVFFIQYKGQKTQQLMQSGSAMPTVASSSGSSNSPSSPKPRTTTTTSKPTNTNTNAAQMMQNLEGYGNDEIADSDFSHDGFIPNEFPPTAYQQQHQHQQRHITNQAKHRPGFGYSPAASHYRIVNKMEGLPPIQPFPVLPTRTDYEQLSEEEKMVQGYPHRPLDRDLSAKRLRCRGFLQQYNQTHFEDEKARREILDGLLHPSCKGRNIYIEPTLRIDYGYNLKVGDNFFATFDCCFLDSAPIEFGDDCMVAPRVLIYTATHPINGAFRKMTDPKNYFELALPVRVAGSAELQFCALWCDTIGNNVVVGAGSVVTKSFPDNVIIAGNPAKVLRHMPPPKAPSEPIWKDLI